jgi:hypothetical protein
MHSSPRQAAGYPAKEFHEKGIFISFHKIGWKVRGDEEELVGQYFETQIPLVFAR